MTNSYVCRSFRRKTSKGGFFAPKYPILNTVNKANDANGCRKGEEEEKLQKNMARSSVSQASTINSLGR